MRPTATYVINFPKRPPLEATSPGHRKNQRQFTHSCNCTHFCEWMVCLERLSWIDAVPIAGRSPGSVSTGRKQTLYYFPCSTCKNLNSSFPVAICITEGNDGLRLITEAESTVPDWPADYIVESLFKLSRHNSTELTLLIASVTAFFVAASLVLGMALDSHGRDRRHEAFARVKT